MWEANSLCTSLWGEFALPPPPPSSAIFRESRRGGDRNEETLDANGERSNVAGKISSGEILAAGCFCIETWPSFFFSFYLLLSPAPPSSLPFDENSTTRQNRHWAMWKLARTRKEASVSNLSGSPLFPQISTLPSSTIAPLSPPDALQVPLFDERQTSSFHFGFLFFWNQFPVGVDGKGVLLRTFLRGFVRNSYTIVAN